MKDVMLDIETLSSGLDACIVAIGAVKFDLLTGETGDRFERLVNLDQLGSEISPSTVVWWTTLSERAQAQLTEEPRIPLVTCLEDLNEFYGNMDCLWTNGPIFDERVMRDAYRRHGIKAKFHFRDSRCCRTIRDLARRKGWVPPAAGFERTESEAHNAIADCVYQINWVCDAWKVILGSA